MPPRVAALSLVLLVPLAVLACSDRDAEDGAGIRGRPTATPPAAAGSLVPWADIPIPLHPVQAAPATLVPSLATPATARTGDTIVYELVLRNTGSAPYRPRDCPVYAAWLHTPSAEPINIAGEPLTLNCEPAGAIPPGGEARFSMEFWIPPATPAGDWILSWGFASPTGTYGIQAHAGVRIAHP